jgi:hypothetical protein
VRRRGPGGRDAQRFFLAARLLADERGGASEPLTGKRAEALSVVIAAGADPWVWRVVRRSRGYSPADVDGWPLPILIQALGWADYDEACERVQALQQASAEAAREALRR